MAKKNMGDCKDWTQMLLRLVLGTIFLVAGIMKLQGGVGGFAGALASTWIPFGHAFFAWVVALSEVIFGALLLLGLWTRWSALPLAVIAFVAMTVKWGGAFGSSGFLGGWNVWRFDLLLLLALLVVHTAGSGKWSADMLMKKK